VRRIATFAGAALAEGGIGADAAGGEGADEIDAAAELAGAVGPVDVGAAEADGEGVGVARGA
jgi:hypothetical protein